MKRVAKLALLASAAVTALAFAGNALAVQKLSVTPSSTGLTVKISQAQTDVQPAKVTIYVPSGYSINTSAAAGTKIGTATGSVFVRDANIPLPLTGDVSAAAPTTNTTGCATGTHLAVWGLNLSVAGQSIPTLNVHVDATAGAESALGAYRLVVCLPPADVPQGTPGRSPNGAQLLEATFTLTNVLTVPADPGVWKAFTTPWTPGVPVPNIAGTVETRAVVSSGDLTIGARVTSRKKRTLRITGKLSQGGAGVAGTQVRLILNGAASRFTARTAGSGAYSLVLRKTGRKSTTTFQARATVAERDVTSTACASPSQPPIPCVSATASGFTAVSKKVKIRL
jgi:hypothetical protein